MQHCTAGLASTWTNSACIGVEVEVRQDGFPCRVALAVDPRITSTRLAPPSLAPMKNKFPNHGQPQSQKRWVGVSRLWASVVTPVSKWRANGHVSKSTPQRAPSSRRRVKPWSTHVQRSISFSGPSVATLTGRVTLRHGQFTRCAPITRTHVACLSRSLVIQATAICTPLHRTLVAAGAGARTIQDEGAPKSLSEASTGRRCVRVVPVDGGSLFWCTCKPSS